MQRKVKKRSLSPWVFPHSGDFMVCTDGEDGGAVPYFDKLYPAFDYEYEDGSTHWCVRHQLLGGDTTPVFDVPDGVAVDMLRGLDVDGHPMTEGEADSMQHEFRAYLCALFAMAPKMQAFLRDKVASCKDRKVALAAEDLLNDLYTSAHGAMRGK